MADDARASVVLDSEDDGEVLFLQHWDLPAQLEAQLRAVHHTLRGIKRLRGGSRRVGPELANGERETILLGLAREINELDRHVTVEHDCYRSVHTTIVVLQERVGTLKRLAARLHKALEPSAQEDVGQAS